jgi:hypothetical protein
MSLPTRIHRLDRVDDRQVDQLVRAAENVAREASRTLLADYALFPHGGTCATTYFYRAL